MRRINPREVIGNKKELRCKKNGCRPGEKNAWSWQTVKCSVCGRLMVNPDRKKKP